MSGTGVRFLFKLTYYLYSFELFSLITSAHHYHQREESFKSNMLKRLLKTQGMFKLQPIFKFSHKNLVNLICFYSTIVGVRCKNGIVLGTEKIVLSKMMIAGTDKRIFSVTTQSGCVILIDFSYLHYRLQMDSPQMESL